MKQPIQTVKALLVLSLVAAAGCHRHGPPPAAANLPPAQVRLLTVESKKHMTTEEVVGTVRSKLRASIEAKVSGRIEQMPVVAGQSVKKGELLAQLDVREIQARLDQARAVRLQAEQDRKRYDTLLQQKAVTQQEYDAIQARFRVADATVTEAEIMLSYARVSAPFDGVISRKYVEVGDLATPGRPLVDLEDPQTLRLEADVPEALIGRLQMGSRMPVRAAPSTNDIEGIIGELSPAADPHSRTVRVKLDLPAAGGLRLGQFGRVAVPVREAVSVRVPAAAVVVRGQMEIVFVVTNQRAHLRLVKTGKRVGDEWEIVSGLNPGEQVVINGAAALQDGQPVEVK